MAWLSCLYKQINSAGRRIDVGMAMVPRCEVGLIFAGLGSAAGVFTDATYTAEVMVIVYTTLLSAFSFLDQAVLQVIQQASV